MDQVTWDSLNDTPTIKLFGLLMFCSLLFWFLSQLRFFLFLDS
jgi:hypothetical protein